MVAESFLPKRSSFNLKLAFGLVFSLLAILAVSLLAYRSVSNLVNALREESRPNQKLILLNEVMFDLADAESNVRAYAITDDIQFLIPYEQAVGTIDEKIEL